MFFKKQRILSRLQISPDRAKLLGVKMIRVKGVTFLIKKVTPTDFMGYDTHPFAPVREAKDRMADVQAQKQLEEKLKSNPDQLPQHIARIKESMRTILLKGVMYPEVSMNEEAGKVWVEDLLNDFSIANSLVEAIGKTSLGEKKTLFGI